MQLSASQDPSSLKSNTAQPNVQQPTRAPQATPSTLINQGFLSNEHAHMIRGILRTVHSSFADIRMPNNAAVSSFVSQHENPISRVPEKIFPNPRGQSSSVPSNSGIYAAQPQSTIPEANSTQILDSSPDTVGDANINGGYHVTVQILTEAIPDVHPQFFIFNDRFPTATANSTVQTPRLIRTIAGSATSGNSVRDTSETPTTSQSLAPPPPPPESLPINTIPHIIQTYPQPPNDPNLNC
ncbi:hypothetical protein MXB_2515, partial [Myxobolus squamalis]